MIHQEEGFNLQIEALLTPEMVADAIIQGIEAEQADITLAPNKDIAYALQIMQKDEQKAVEMMGVSFSKQRSQQKA
ncbi:hypothetical protein [Ktedonospora formicarum]|uniref:Uncharacterized protein n=1 Tax=Ktedonospora formicarum TaxID=2778364 RepID=A0A8J3I4I6_9CHLR|nr:hypothetical protein [Ktedonospora formicarum]GHO50087.1 hypothetical protein KSX_82500 [Ktedonospora formicarum]